MLTDDQGKRGKSDMVKFSDSEVLFRHRYLSKNESIEIWN